MVDYVQRLTGADYPHIMLLRHSKDTERLLKLGGTVEEFTSLQRVGTKWDFWDARKEELDRIDVVAVIFRDLVHGIYRILGVEAEGTVGSLASKPYRKFNLERDPSKLDRLARRFRLAKVPSAAEAEDVRVTGWKGKEINAVLRSNGNLFWEIEVELEDDGRLADEVDTAGLHEGAFRRVTVNAYERNAKARRQCIAAHQPRCSVCGFDFGASYGPEFAGFIHVHHLVPMSEVGGEYVVDPVEDLKPVCPNCHAVIHHGGRLRSIEEVRHLLAQQRHA